MKSAIAEELKLEYEPVAILFTDEKPEGAQEPRETDPRCVIGLLTAAAEEGRITAFKAETVECGGGMAGLGFDNVYDEDFTYFLSQGREDLEGEGYKKTPELAQSLVDSLPDMDEIEGKYRVFMPLSRVKPEQKPNVVVFYAKPDQISALVVLANYARKGVDNVITPFGSGCQTACLLPYEERNRDNPRAVLGMTDISARPYVDAETLSFAVPFNMFVEMEENVPGSFLERRAWLNGVRPRLEG